MPPSQKPEQIPLLSLMLFCLFAALSFAKAETDSKSSGSSANRVEYLFLDRIEPTDQGPPSAFGIFISAKRKTENNLPKKYILPMNLVSQPRPASSKEKPPQENREAIQEGDWFKLKIAGQGLNKTLTLTPAPQKTKQARREIRQLRDKLLERGAPDPEKE